MIAAIIALAISMLWLLANEIVDHIGDWVEDRLS